MFSLTSIWTLARVSLLIFTMSPPSIVGDTVNLNEAVDQLLAGMREEVTAKGMDVVPVPDFSKDWRERWHFIKVSGNFNCQGGKAGTLTSLRRTGDVTMTTTPNTLTLSAKMGLTDLWANFDNCQLKVHRVFSASHALKASMDGNSVSAQITLHHDGPACTVSLDHISIDDIGQINIRIGGSVFQKFLNKILSAIANHFRDDMKKIIDKKLTEAAQQALSKVDLCKKIPH